jgi:hypothetical protein
VIYMLGRVEQRTNALREEGKEDDGGVASTDSREDIQLTQGVYAFNGRPVRPTYPAIPEICVSSSSIEK